MNMLPLALSVALLSGIAAPTHAQDAQGMRNQAQAVEQEQLTLTLENADISDLVRWASQYISKNIILHPDVKGRVTVISGQPISKDEAYGIFKSVLQVHGFAVVETEDAIKILPEAAATQGRLAVEGKKSSITSEDLEIRVVRLNNIPATQALPMLKPLMPQSATITAYPDSNLLVLSDRAANIAKLLAVIQRVDQAGVVEIEVIHLQQAQATSLLQTLNGVLPNAGKGQADGARGLSISADPRTNSLLVSGNPAARSQVRALINSLDQSMTGDNQTKVVRVSFSEVKSLLPILQNTANTINSRRSGGTPANGSAGNNASEVKIEASEQHNALIVTAPSDVQDAIATIVDELDTRRPQVLVEALIVEVTDDVARDLGVRWRTSRPGEGGFASGGAIRGNIKDAEPDIRSLTSLGSGLTLGFYSSDELRGLVRALETNTAANILSKPTIVAQDNDQAEILVGENVPFVTGSLANAATPAANPFQTIERYDIGITLRVKPRVNRDNSITLEVEQKAESIAPSRADAADLITSKRSVKTKVVVDDDQVLVLGGLIRDETNREQAGVPFLGNIPYLGRLFRGTSDSSNKKNLMVFIHPRILLDAEDNEQISLPLYNGMEQRRQDFKNGGETYRIDSAPLELEEIKN